MLFNGVTTHSIRHTEIDTARRYGNGTSETMLGELKSQERGLHRHHQVPPRSNAETGSYT